MVVDSLRKVPKGRMAGASKRNAIDKLDFPAPNQQTPLLHGTGERDNPSQEQQSQTSTTSAHFFQDVAEGIYAKDREAIRRETVRYVSFFWAVVCWYTEAFTSASIEHTG